MSSSSSSRLTRSWLTIASVLGSVALVGVCVMFANPAAVLTQLSRVEVRWLFPAFALHLAQIAVLGHRWSAIARIVGVELPWLSACAEYALSTILNQLLPTGVAGDGVRALRHSREISERGVSTALEVLALDRASGQLGLWLTLLLTLPLTPVQIEIEGRALAAGGAVIALVIALWVLVSKLSPAQGSPLSSLRAFLQRASRLLFSPSRAARHLPASLTLVALSTLQWLVAASALGVELEVDECLILGPWFTLAASAPSLLGGWGLREGASGALFGALGLGVSTGVSISLVYGVFALVVSAPGLLVALGTAAKPRL